MTIKHPDDQIAWLIEQSHLIATPKWLITESLQELRRRVQNLADTRTDRKLKHKRPYGKIDYRYEVDDDDVVMVVHCSFKGHNGLRRRFMKLRRMES